MSDATKGFTFLLLIIGAVLMVLHIWTGDERWLRTAAIPASVALLTVTASSIGRKVADDRKARDEVERRL